jgi:hypothetical protein
LEEAPPANPRWAFTLLQVTGGETHQELPCHQAKNSINNISTSIIGASIGAITSVAVAITKELFGTKGFSMNYNLLIANIPLGSFAFGYEAASLYRKEGMGACMGMECYRTNFIIWGSLCAVGKLL